MMHEITVKAWRLIFLKRRLVFVTVVCIQPYSELWRHENLTSQETQITRATRDNRDANMPRQAEAR